LEDRILDLIYGAVADPQRWPEVLTGVSDHIGALGGMIAYVPPPSAQRQPTQILGRLPEEPSALFRERHAWNPWTVVISQYQPGKAVSANSLLKEPALLRKTEFYADVLAPWGHADIVDINHKALSVDGAAGGFGFCLSERGAERADEHVRRLDPLTPHLCRALEASLLMGGRADGRRQLSAILDLMPNAALLLDGRGSITQTNRAAEALLRQSDGIAFDRDGSIELVSALSGERQALSRALKGALNVAAGAGVSLPAPVRVSRPSGAAPLLVVAVPLPRPSFAFWELVAPARVLVVIVDPAARSRATASAIQAAYGLTAAEARVALLLASGVNGSQMPDLLGVTAATVKTQLRRCFEKTGTHSQAELSRLFTMFPPTGTLGDH
jgi:DNA-binding CsgD family transcriptional regulator/PAS domain-containing protein